VVPFEQAASASAFASILGERLFGPAAEPSSPRSCSCPVWGPSPPSCSRRPGYTSRSRRTGSSPRASPGDIPVSELERGRRHPGAVLEGKKKEAIAAVPSALVDDVALCGPRERIADRVQAWKDAGVLHPDLHPARRLGDESHGRGPAPIAFRCTREPERSRNENQRRDGDENVSHLGPLRGRRFCPGVSPVSSPPSRTRFPLTITCATPSENGWGSSHVDRSAMVSGSKTVRSAAIPSARRPRSSSPRFDAGREVIFRIASSRLRSPSSRT